jgi:hypothetical protein
VGRGAGITGADVFTGKMVKGRVLPMNKAWAAKFKKRRPDGREHAEEKLP